MEEMRYKCGDMLAIRDEGEVHPDIVAGVPDSGYRSCNRLCKPFRCALCTAIYQIHADLATLLYADAAEPAEFDCQNEVDSGTSSD